MGRGGSKRIGRVLFKSQQNQQAIGDSARCRVQDRLTGRVSVCVSVGATRRQKPHRDFSRESLRWGSTNLSRESQLEKQNESSRLVSECAGGPGGSGHAWGTRAPPLARRLEGLASCQEGSGKHCPGWGPLRPVGRCPDGVWCADSLL